MTSRSIHIPEQSGGTSRGAIPQHVYLTGMYLALAAIVMFFTALVSAWVVRKGLSTSTLEAPLELPERLLGLNTILLVASSVTLEIARRGLRLGNRDKFRRWWYATSALGLAFLIGQFFAWRAMASAGVDMASNPDASFFYLFTAAHGIHSVGGVCGLWIVTTRNLRHMALGTAARVAATYWHFLTLLWCAIFVLLMVTGA